MRPHDAPSDETASRSQSPLVAAVVLNWNKTAETTACVEALARTQYSNLKIIIVDNGSRDGSLLALADLPASIELIRNPCNLGFAGGVNIGIGHALRCGAAYVWLVNNDAQPEPWALGAMLDALGADPSIGMASPMILNADANDAIEFSGGLWLNNAFHTTNDIATYERWSRAHPDRIWVVGTAMLMRRELAERNGPFDERLFAYWEDNDYSIRAMRSGFRNVVVTDAVVRHWSGTPTTNPDSKPAYYFYYMARNELLFLRKHLSLVRRTRPFWWALRRQMRQLRQLDNPALTHALLLGLYDGLMGRGGAFDGSRQLPLLARHLFSRTRG